MLASNQHSVIGEFRYATDSGDKFRVSSIAPQNPESIYIDLRLQGGVEQPQNTCEKQLKAAVLKKDGSAQVGAFARGHGGVGKTCALRAIANDEDVIGQFPGGIYFMQLGADANVPKLIQQLCRTVTATGGYNIADKMQEKKNLEEALDLMLSWFGGHVCLFIFDDVWVRNGIDTNVLNQLSVLVGNWKDDNGRQSRILYSTRDSDLTMLGREVVFELREKDGTDAVNMFLKASNTPGYEKVQSGRKRVRTAEFCERFVVDGSQLKMDIGAILDVCAGLPLALSAAGKNIRLRKRRNGGDFSGACSAYLQSVSDGGGMSVESPGDGYLSLEATLRSSLELLDSNIDAGSMTNRMSFKDMHRALCVMKKQDWIPTVVLCDLWDIHSVREAERFASEMNRAGLVDLEDRDCTGVRVHDLTHDFAVREAGEGCVLWYTKLLDKYGRDGNGGIVKVASRIEGTGGNKAREEYMFENIYRLLTETERIRELRDLLLSAGWAKRVVERKAVLQFEDAVGIMKKHRGESARGGGIVRDIVDEGSMCGMELVMRALRLSLLYCDDSDEGTWFQLYARTMHKGSSLKSVEKFLSEIEELAPRPWLRPVNECLHAAGEKLLDAVIIPEPFRSWYLEMRQSTETGPSGELCAVGCVWFEDRSEVCVFKYSEGKPLEIVGSCGAGEEIGTVEPDAGSNEASSPNGLNLGTEIRVSEKRSANRERGLGLVRRVGCLEVFRRRLSGGSASSPRSIGRRPSSEVSSSGGVSDQSLSSTIYRNDLVTRAHVCGRGKRVAVGYNKGAVKVWSVEERKVIRAFQVDGSVPRCLFLSADGKLLACGGSDGPVLLWNVESDTGGCVMMRGHTAPVNCVVISADGNFVVSGSRDGSIRVWDAASGSPVGQPITGHTYAVFSVALSGDGRRLLSGSRDLTVRLWDPHTGSQIGPTMCGHTGYVTSVAMREDGRRAISASQELIVWDVETQTQLGDPIHEPAREVTLNADGRRALSSFGSALKVWNLEAGAEAEDRKARQKGWVSSLSMSTNGQRIISGSWAKTVRAWTVRAWDVESGRQVGTAMVGHTGLVRDVAISANRKYAVSGSEDKTVRAWDMESGTKICDVMTGHTDEVLSVAMSGDGKRAVSGSLDRTALVWDLERGAQVGEALSGHEGWVERVGMNEDGTRVLSLTGETIRVWDVEKGRCTEEVSESEIGWQAARERFLGDGKRVVEEGGTGKEGWERNGGTVSNIFKRDDSILQRREDGTEITLARFEAFVTAFQVDHGRGIVAAALSNGVVAVLKVVC